MTAAATTTTRVISGCTKCSATTTTTNVSRQCFARSDANRCLCKTATATCAIVACSMIGIGL